MNEERTIHSAVSMGNKLFVNNGFNTTSSEVFDSCSRKFTEINSGIKVPDLKSCHFESVCIGNYVVGFQSFLGFNYSETTIYLYDVLENK